MDRRQEMQLILCVDDGYGMLFNNRRVSRDRAVIDKIKEMAAGKRLWIREFSKKLFGDDVTIDEDMLLKAEKDDLCFVEDADISPALSETDVIYLFKWNRKYPSDVVFEKENLASFHLETTEEFEGNSHEKITLERWTR